MTVKLIAALITIGGCFSVGILLSASEQRSVLNAAAFLGLTEYIIMKISYSRTPIHEILSSYSDERLERFKTAMISGESRNIAEKWCRAVPEIVLKDAVKRELLLFGCDIGTLDSESQLKKAESCAAFLRQYIESSSFEAVSKSKMYRAIAALTGFMIVIFLF